MGGTHLFCTNTLKLHHIENIKTYDYYILNDCLNPKEKNPGFLCCLTGGLLLILPLNLRSHVFFQTLLFRFKRRSGYLEQCIMERSTHCWQRKNIIKKKKKRKKFKIQDQFVDLVTLQDRIILRGL